MSLVLFAVVVFAALFLGYRFYSSRIAAAYKLDPARETPSVTMQDGVDYVPTKKSILLAQHFSAIAAAGPIVGPILAGIYFGWLPAILWIVFGNIFIGAVHDMSTLFASVRHRGSSIAELAREYISRRAYLLFMAFIWVALLFVIVAFTDLTVRTFVSTAEGPGVASSSVLYLVLGVLLGVVMRYVPLPLWLITTVSLPLLALLIWAGPFIPVTLGLKTWTVILLAYCFFASVLPMWLLLQPRGYLGGWFLYGTLAISVVGILLGGFSIEYPAFVTFNAPIGMLFPVMFTTIACGACSGFHGLVCSGTTSKQLANEAHARPVGYGGMLLEGVVALIALCTVMMLQSGDPLLKGDPTMLYAKGIARFAEVTGIPSSIALSFGLLAFATFVYDTLDVSTRLARYVFQEVTGIKGKGGAFLATAVTLGVAALFLLTTEEKAYAKFWPVFGASNQLLAALSLLAIFVWLRTKKESTRFVLIPMLFVMSITIWALFLQARKWNENGVVAAVLIILGGLVVVEAVRRIRR